MVTNPISKVQSTWFSPLLKDTADAAVANFPGCLLVNFTQILMRALTIYCQRTSLLRNTFKRVGYFVNPVVKFFEKIDKTF